jgi:hypothetical protein
VITTHWRSALDNCEVRAGDAGFVGEVQSYGAVAKERSRALKS